MNLIVKAHVLNALSVNNPYLYEDIYDLVTSIKKVEIELHPFIYFNKKYLGNFHIGKKNYVSLKRFGFKKQKVFLYKINSPERVEKDIHKLMESGIKITNLDQVLNVVGLKTKQSHDNLFKNGGYKLRLKLVILIIKGKRYLVSLDSELNLEDFKFKKVWGQVFETGELSETIQTIKKIKENDISIYNEKELSLFLSVPLNTLEINDKNWRPKSGDFVVVKKHSWDDYPEFKLKVGIVIRKGRGNQYHVMFERQENTLPISYKNLIPSDRKVPVLEKYL